MNEAELGRLVVRLIGNGSSFMQMAQQAKAGTVDLSKTLNQSSKDAVVFGKVIDDLGTKMSNMAGQFRAMVAIESPFQFLKDSVRLAGQTERMQTEFGVMLQSAEKGKQLTKSIQSFASATPLSLMGLQQASKTLLQFNIEADDLMPTLKMLGDTVGGDEEKLQSMARAFGQMTSTGRLLGGDLMQMINVGFNPLQEISRTTGKSMAELKDDMEKGRITVDMVNKAFRSATSAGGRFKDGMEEASKTLEGKFSTMKDEIDQFKGAVGAAVVESFNLKGRLDEIADAARFLTRNFNELNPVVKSVAASVIALTLALGTLIIAWKVGAIAVGMTIGVLKDVYISMRAVIVATYAWTAALATQTVVMKTAASTIELYMGAQATATRTNWSAVAAAFALKAAIVIGVVYAIRELIFWANGGNKAMRELNDELKKTGELSDRLASMKVASMGKVFEKGEGIANITDKLAFYQAQLSETTNELLKNDENIEGLKRNKDKFDMNSARRFVARNTRFGEKEQLEKIEEIERNLAQAEGNKQRMTDQTAKLRMALKDAEIRHNLEVKKAITAVNEQLGMQIGSFGKTANQVELYKLKMAGANDEQLTMTKQLQFLNDVLNAHKKLVDDAKKAAEEMAKADIDMFEKLFAAGEQLNNEFATPLDKFNTKMQELQDMLDMGAITQETFAAASAQAKEQLDSATKSVEEHREALLSLDSVLSGSAEAKARVAAFRMTVQDETADRRRQRAADAPSNSMPANAQGNNILVPLLQQIRDILKKEAEDSGIDIALSEFDS